MSFIVSEIISSDLDNSQKLIFWCKKRRFPRKIGIPGNKTKRLQYVSDVSQYH